MGRNSKYIWVRMGSSVFSEAAGKVVYVLDAKLFTIDSNLLADIHEFFMWKT